MDTLALALLALFAAGWFVLGGADIGTGMLIPYLGRDARERRLVIASFAPFFLANEVWLVALAGVLAGCFPELEGRLLAGQLPVLVALLAALAVRDLGLWSRQRGPGARWRALCDGAVTAGSWGLALATGWLLAALLTGRPYEPAGGPVAVLTALAVAALCAAHGLGFAALCLTGVPYERARRLVGRAGRPWHPFALTAVLLGGLPLAAGSVLAPGSHTADPATLRLLVPVLLAVTVPMLGVQAWIRCLFGHRVTGPSYF